MTTTSYLQYNMKKRVVALYKIINVMSCVSSLKKYKHLVLCATCGRIPNSSHNASFLSLLKDIIRGINIFVPRFTSLMTIYCHKHRDIVANSLYRSALYSRTSRVGFGQMTNFLTNFHPLYNPLKG